MSSEEWDQGRWVVGGSTSTGVGEKELGRSESSLPSPDDVLLEAVKLTEGQRQEDYGPPGVCLGRIANLWNVYFGWGVTSEKVAQAMMLVKMARLMQSSTKDSYVDIAGYARLAWLTSTGPVRSNTDKGQEV
jgi:hypothetical protein